MSKPIVIIASQRTGTVAFHDGVGAHKSLTSFAEVFLNTSLHIRMRSNFFFYLKNHLKMDVNGNRFSYSDFVN